MATGNRADWSRRDFPRWKEALNVRYEFVAWDESSAAVGPAAESTSTVDISAAGLGLSEVPMLNEALKAKLLSGHRKVRLEMTLSDGRRLNLFARLIWAGLTGSLSTDSRAGFSFLDISPRTFAILLSYVDQRLLSDAAGSGLVDERTTPQDS